MKRSGISFLYIKKETDSTFFIMLKIRGNMNNMIKPMLASVMLVFSTFSHAIDSTITVTGSVLQRTCTINSKDVTVPLGVLYTSDLKLQNNASQWVNFDLSLTNCQNMTNVTATFSGTPDSTDYYANAGDASNIMIELQEQNGNTSLKSGAAITQSVNNNNATFNLRARAVSKGNTGAGTINSQITVTYTYA